MKGNHSKPNPPIKANNSILDKLTPKDLESFKNLPFNPEVLDSMSKKEALELIISLKAFDNPLPSAEEIEKLEKIYPRAAKLIFLSFKGHSDYATKGSFWLTFFTLILFLVVIGGIVAVAIYLTLQGRSIEALIAILTPALGFLGLVFASVKKSNSDKK